MNQHTRNILDDICEKKRSYKLDLDPVKLEKIDVLLSKVLKKKYYENIFGLNDRITIRFDNDGSSRPSTVQSKCWMYSSRGQDVDIFGCSYEGLGSIKSVSFSDDIYNFCLSKADKYLHELKDAIDDINSDIKSQIVDVISESSDLYKTAYNDHLREKYYKDLQVLRYNDLLATNGLKNGSTLHDRVKEKIDKIYDIDSKSIYIKHIGGSLGEYYLNLYAKADYYKKVGNYSYLRDEKHICTLHIKNGVITCSGNISNKAKMISGKFTTIGFFSKDLKDEVVELLKFDIKGK